MDKLKGAFEHFIFNDCLKCSDTECFDCECGFYPEEEVCRRFGMDYDSCSTKYFP